MMWNWIKRLSGWVVGSRKAKEVIEPEVLRFTKAFCERNEIEIHENGDYYASHEIQLRGDGVQFIVKHDLIRLSFGLLIWDTGARDFLYYKDPATNKALNFLRKKYNLDSLFEASIKRKQDSEDAKQKIIEDRKNAYLSNDGTSDESE